MLLHWADHGSMHIYVAYLTQHGISHHNRLWQINVIFQKECWPFYDTLTYNGKQLHPRILTGHCITSCRSTLHWVNFPKPPKKVFILWQEFVTTCLTPLHTTCIIQWDTTTIRCRTDPQWYQLKGTETTLNPAILQSFTRVEVAHYKTFIQLICLSNINSHNTTSPTSQPTTLKDLYKQHQNILPTWRRTCYHRSHQQCQGLNNWHQWCIPKRQTLCSLMDPDCRKCWPH